LSEWGKRSQEKKWIQPRARRIAEQAILDNYALSSEGFELVISSVDLGREDGIEVLGFVRRFDTLQLGKLSIFIYSLLTLLSIRHIFALLSIAVLLALLVRLAGFLRLGVSLLLLLLSLLLLLFGLLGSLSSLLFFFLALGLLSSSSYGSWVDGGSRLRWSSVRWSRRIL
jgi:hypothetical protein